MKTTLIEYLRNLEVIIVDDDNDELVCMYAPLQLSEEQIRSKAIDFLYDDIDNAFEKGEEFEEQDFTDYLCNQISREFTDEDYDVEDVRHAPLHGP